MSGGITGVCVIIRNSKFVWRQPQENHEIEMR